MTASNMGNGPDKNFNTKEERKLRKPLIEKRRRERINCSLEQLKGIMVDAYNLDQSKLEKADVLEITVQHMEGLQKGHGPGSPTDPGRVGPGFESRQRYSSGYIQCMHEVHNLLLTCPGMDKPLGARLLNHLLQSLPHVGADAAGTPGGANTGGGGGGSPLPVSGPASPPHSPLLPLPATRAPFRPRRLLLQPPLPPRPSSPSDPPPASPPPPPRGAAQGAPVTDGRGARERIPASPPSSPTPFSSPGLPRPGAPVALPAPLPSAPGGDPSMWRPW